MDGIEFTNPMFLVSLVLGAGFLVAASAAYQIYGPDAEGEVKPKALLRDGLLGGIFAAMAWTLVPESMNAMYELLDKAGSDGVHYPYSLVSKELNVYLNATPFFSSLKQRYDQG